MAAGVTVAEPEIPEAVKLEPLQEVAFVELQVSVDDCPDEIEAGLAVRVAVGGEGGGGGMVTVTVALAPADPPLPVQVIE